MATVCHLAAGQLCGEHCLRLIGAEDLGFDSTGKASARTSARLFGCDVIPSSSLSADR
jgi:hypothetical protein